MGMMKKPLPFFQNGLKFTCTQCHACCRHDPGFVFLSRTDMDRLCEGVGLPEAEFKARYTRVVDFGFAKCLSLTEKANYDCIFWREGIGCSVYEHRPLQCRAFPFWSQNLENREAWDDAAQSCPGMNQGKLHSHESIRAWLAAREAEPPLEE